MARHSITETSITSTFEYSITSNSNENRTNCDNNIIRIPSFDDKTDQIDDDDDDDGSLTEKEETLSR